MITTWDLFIDLITIWGLSIGFNTVLDLLVGLTKNIRFGTYSGGRWRGGRRRHRLQARLSQLDDVLAQGASGNDSPVGLSRELLIHLPGVFLPIRRDTRQQKAPQKYSQRQFLCFPTHPFPSPCLFSSLSGRVSDTLRLRPSMT